MTEWTVNGVSCIHTYECVERVLQTRALRLTNLVIRFILSF